MVELTEPDPIDKDSPFHKDNAPGLTLIATLRLYDVGMAILNKLDPAAAEAIYEAHAQGRVIGSLPIFTMGDEDAK